MLTYPEDLKYSDSHEYVRVDGDKATIGISAYAVDLLGDIVFVDLPQPGDTVTRGETFGTVESVKAVEDMYAPVTGEVLETNLALLDTPEQIAADPYGAAWLLKVRLRDLSELDSLLTVTDYRRKVEGI